MIAATLLPVVEDRLCWHSHVQGQEGDSRGHTAHGEAYPGGQEGSPPPATTNQSHQMRPRMP